MTPLRRRDLVVATAGAAVLVRPAVARAQGGREADVLTRALRFEHASVVSYDAVAAAGALDGAAARRLARLRGHEAEHAAALARALRDLGERVPVPPRGPEQVDVPQLRAGIDALDGPGTALALLAEVERLSLDVHRAALAALRDLRHIRLVATILAAEATHLVAWRAVG